MCFFFNISRLIAGLKKHTTDNVDEDGNIITKRKDLTDREVVEQFKVYDTAYDVDAGGVCVCTKTGLK